MEGLRKQDNKVLAYLYASYAPIVKDLVRKYRGSTDKTDDVLQESIIAIYHNIRKSDFELKGELSTYFYGIARNILFAMIRLDGKHIHKEIDLPEEPPLEQIRKEAYHRMLQKAWVKLSKECQKVLNLVNNGISFREIAQKLRMSSEEYARRKKYLCKENLVSMVKKDPEYQEIQDD